MTDLKKTVVNGVIWQISGRYSALIIQFFVTIVLARILSPADYGTIAILNVFIVISTLLVDSGFGQALIQKGNANNRDFSTIFYFNLFFSFLLYFLLFFMLPEIGSFYDNLDLSYYGKILFLVIPISSIGIVQNTRLQQSMKFRDLSIIQILSALISGFVGVYMAYNNYGIMSLVYHSITLNISKTILLLLFNRWMPIYGFSFKTIKELLPFSFSLLSTDFVKVIFNNIYTLVIGKAYSAESVGYYNQATRLQELSGNTILDVIINVTFPALVKIKNDMTKVKEVYSQILQTVIILISPLMFILILLANEIIELVLSSKWLPAVPYFQILCVYSLTLPLHLISVNILKIYGKGKSIFKLELIRRILLIIAIVITFKISISALLIGQVFAMLPMIIISMSISGKIINFSFIEQIKEVAPYYLFSLLSFFIVYLLSKYLLINSLIIYIITITFIFMLFYILLNILFPTKYVRNNARQIIQTLKNKSKTKRK
ncbi:MAG: lipopolysaccharide biosynthesis protein [Bacteroidales bacterium]|jgi:O-antigen/teichoic acid export membrane protein